MLDDHEKSILRLMALQSQDLVKGHYMFLTSYLLSLHAKGMIEIKKDVPFNGAIAPFEIQLTTNGLVYAKLLSDPC